MNQTVEAGKTLLVDGPASVRVVSGKAEVLGLAVKQAGRIVVREGLRLPFFVAKTASLDVSLGENASVEEVEGDTVPVSWVDAVEVLMGFQKPTVAMVVGKADSGKTSFCIYLVNKLVNPNQSCNFRRRFRAIQHRSPVHGRLCSHTKPLTELYDLKARNAFFVGVTSPSEAIIKTIEGLALIKAEVLDVTADFVVVNTDGWVEGEEAVKYKLQLAEMLEPDGVVCIRQKNELESLLAALGKYRTIEIKSFWLLNSAAWKSARTCGNGATRNI